MNTSLRIDNCSAPLRSCWHPVALSEALTDQPVGVRLLGESWVLARIDGRVMASPDKCPHRGAPLSAGCIDDGALRCAYHGWRFAPDGRCVDIPALGRDAPIPPRAAIATALVEERGGLVWLAPESPITPLPPMPVVEGAAQILVTDWASSAAHMLDNFIDVGHFAFSHAPSFGVPDDATAVAMDNERDGWTFTVTHRHRAKLVDSPEWSAGTAQPFARTEIFRYNAPFTLQLDLVYDDVPDHVTLIFAVQPVDQKLSRLYSLAIRNDGAASRCTPAEGLERGMLIIDEDRKLLEQVAEPYLDLAPSAELHTRGDRSTLLLRRVLADLIV